MIWMLLTLLFVVLMFSFGAAAIVAVLEWYIKTMLD